MPALEPTVPPDVELVIKIGSFLAFLVLYAGLVFAAYRVQIRSSRRPLSSAGTWLTGLFGIGQVVVMTLNLYLLARFFNGWLTASLLMVSAISLVLGLVARGFVGSRSELVENLWEGFGIGVRSPGTPMALNILGVVIIVGYPLAAGIVFVSHELGSPSETLWILRLTLLGLFLGGQLLVVLATGPLLLSRFVEDDARRSMLVGRTLALITGAMYLAMTLFAFNVVRERGSFSVEAVIGELSLAFVAGLMVYFIATALVPYLVGSKRSAAWRGAFETTRGSLVDELLEALALPGKDVKLARLEQLQARLQNEEAELRQDELVAVWETVDRGELDPQALPELVRGTVEALDESKQEFQRRDPRFQHLSWLDEFGERLAAITAAIGSKRTEPQVRDLSNEWIGFYRGQRDEMAKRVAAASPAKSRLATAASFLVSTGAIGIVTGETAKIISQRIAESLGP